MRCSRVTISLNETPGGQDDSGGVVGVVDGSQGLPHALQPVNQYPIVTPPYQSGTTPFCAICPKMEERAAVEHGS